MTVERTIRPARPADYPRIRELVCAAFAGTAMGDNGEAGIVERARAEGSAVVDLVAETDGLIVGHVLFTRMTADRPVSLMALAPVSVDPACQSQDHGGALIRAGIEACREAGADGLIVLGHPAYYPRFGFSADAAKTVASPYAGGRSFMAMPLTPGVFDAPIRADYPPAFG